MKFVLGSVSTAALLCLMAGAAYADGPFGSLKDTTPVLETPSWTGFYFGAGWGYGHNRSKNNYHDNAGDSD